MMRLSCGEGSAHGANNLGIRLSFLLDLQKLRSLDERLQSLLGAAVCQVPLHQPLLQLPDIVPEDRGTGQTIQTEPRLINKI